MRLYIFYASLFEEMLNWEVSNCFPCLKHLNHFIFPQAMYRVSHFPTCQPTLIFHFFNCSHANGYSVVPYCGLDSHLLMVNDVELFFFFFNVMVKFWNGLLCSITQLTKSKVSKIRLHCPHGANSLMEVTGYNLIIIQIKVKFKLLLVL